MTIPNFFVIGANRSGTTSLHYYLDSHPQVFMPKNKEPHYFMVEGIEYDVNRPDQATTRGIIWDRAEYEALFDGVTDEIAIGESSTGYLPNPNAPVRIKASVPDAKLIAILRNPVERAHSAFSKYVEYGIETDPDFGVAVEKELAGGDWRHYVSLGFYGEHLKRYYKLFPESQLRIYLNEELDQQPEMVLRDIFGYLGVDTAHKPDFSRRYNRSEVPPERLAATQGWQARIKRQMNKFSGTSAPTRPLKPELTGEVRARLIEVYRSDIMELEELIHRDLSAWLK